MQKTWNWCFSFKTKFTRLKKLRRSHCTRPTWKKILRSLSWGKLATSNFVQATWRWTSWRRTWSQWRTSLKKCLFMKSSVLNGIRTVFAPSRKSPNSNTTIKSRWRRWNSKLKVSSMKDLTNSNKRQVRMHKEVSLLSFHSLRHTWNWEEHPSWKRKTEHENGVSACEHWLLQKRNFLIEGTK